MMWKPVDFYLVCLFCLLFFFYYFDRRYLLPCFPSNSISLPSFFPRSPSFVVGLRVLLTLPGVAGFPARHRQESDRSEVRPSGTYIIIDDNMNTFTHISLFRWTALGLSTSNSSLGFSLLSWLVFIFSRQLYQTISITSRERSWGDPVWVGEGKSSIGILSRIRIRLPTVFPLFPPSTLTASLTSEASLPPFNLLFIIPFSLSPPPAFRPLISFCLIHWLIQFDLNHVVIFLYTFSFVFRVRSGRISRQ